MSLSPGTRLGSYEITSKLGAGGMGEVYRARDTKLGRDVAIKALPESFAADPERLARLRREAQVLASLNHPNIAHVYGLEDHGGAPALVMELVPGDDLAARIARGPIPLAEALPIARQIAMALEAAHDQAIVHRDLKPANIKVSDEGVVKVLDFGLAKAFAPEGTSGAGDAMNSPTLTARATELGVILGTAAYMAPEQARGRPVDRRADMWAFGVVLYEMLTGRRAFEGGDVTEVLASVIKDTPPLDALPPETPPAIRKLLTRCLQKDRTERLADAGAARLEIADATTSQTAGAPSAASGLPAKSRSIAMPLVAVAAIAAIAAGSAAWLLKPAPVAATPAPVHYSVQLPQGFNWSRNTHHVIAITRDGTKVAYTANTKLFVRSSDQFAPVEIKGAADPAEVFFSPDGKWLGFYSAGKIYRVSVAGGVPELVCQLAGVNAAFWGENDWIVLATPTTIMRVRATSGTPDTIVTREGANRLSGPVLLPGGNAVLYATGQTTTTEDASIMLEDLNTHEKTVLVRGGSDPRLVAGKYLLFVRASQLMGVEFDPSSRSVRGTPVPLLNDVARSVAGLNGSGQFGVSDTGTLVYVAGSSVPEMQLAWLTRDGKETPIAMATAANYPRVSPDGKKLAFTSVPNGNSDIYVRDRATGAQSRVTFDAGRDVAPVWTPDSRKIVFGSTRDGAQNLYWQNADGTGTAERLTTSTDDQWPYAVTKDGATLLYIDVGATTSYDIYSMSLQGDRTPRPVLVTQFDERRPTLSPDGKFMAYQSTENGPFEIFVRPFPNINDGRWQVSNAGGSSSPIWSHDGKEIYFRRDSTIQHVAVKTTPTFSNGTPETLVSFALQPDAAGMSYTVDPTTGSFLVARPAMAVTGSLEYRVMLNWIESVRPRLTQK